MRGNSSAPPLMKRIGAAPHRYLALTERLSCQPLDHVVAISRVVRERLEFAAGISTAADIHERKGVAARGEVSGARVVAVRDIRREGEYGRRLRRGAVRRFRQVEGGVELNLSRIGIFTPQRRS